MTMPCVSVVVPTKNGAATVVPLLDGLRRQQLELPLELVCVDSGSTDGTRELVKDRVDRLITISADAFNHGLTRNLGIEKSRGDFVVLLVQDAQPASQHLLRELVAPLLADSAVAGTFARQVPNPKASAITRHYLTRWVATSEHARIMPPMDRAELESLEPAQRVSRCAFDNVCACLRRTVWREHPLRRTPIAEDLAWAREVLLAGHRLVYTPRAVVVHSHERSAWHEFARTRLLHEQLFDLFELQTIPSLPLLFRAVATSLLLHLRLERVASRRMPRAMALALAWPCGQYLGGRAGLSNRTRATLGLVP